MRLLPFKRSSKALCSEGVAELDSRAKEVDLHLPKPSSIGNTREAGVMVISPEEDARTSPGEDLDVGTTLNLPRTRET